MNPTSDTARVPFPSSPPKTQNTRQPSIVIPTSNSSTIPSRRTNLSRPSPLSRLHSSPGASRPEADKNRPGMFKAPPSPCYVHSHLEKYGQLPAPPYNHTPWNSTSQQSLGGKHEEQEKRRDGQAGLSTQKADPPLSRTSEISTPASAQEQSHTPYAADIVTGLSAVSTIHPDASDGSRVKSRLQVSAPAWEDLDDAEDGGSITRQLAETATGVREMSKQLGRTKVKSNIQHVLIVTKARDNGLIKLTREVAVYLMNKKTGNNGRSNGRGMVVYVDSQLRTSKRFNAAGLEKEHPEFFKPYPRRRSSSSASIHTLSTSISEVSLLSRASSISGAKRRSDNGRDADNDQGQLRYWTADMCSNTPNLFDFVVTLGGDGTVLFTSWLFQRIVPPVLPFALGSLGFLTNFDYSNFQKTIDHVVDDGIRVNLRMRFTCVVYRAVAPDEVKHKGSNRKAIKSTGGDILISRVGKQGWDALENTNAGAPPCKQKKDKEIMCYTTRPVETFEVLNDLVVDRGPSPYVSLLELFGDDHHLTTVQADGLCIATPTGSTAYSLSAGGSLVHPGIPALLISPICPHTLSFRPMLLPDSMEVRVCVPYNSRSTAWASFDGRGRIELKQGDYIKVTASKYPFPTVCAEERSVDWFQSISRTLRWNEREKQKSFVVVEEDRPKSAKEKLSKNADRRETTTGTFKPTEDERRLKASKQEAQDGQDSLAQKTDDESKRQAKQRGDLVQDEETDETSEEEEEEGFDIDDISSNTAESTSPKESREESPAARPKYSSKRPSQLAGLLGQDGMKSGVDTPDRFFFPQKAHPGGPLSPKAFTSALNRGLTKLSGREKLDESSKREPQGKGVDKGGQHDDISEVSLRPSMADDGGSSGRHEEDEERPDLGTPKPVQPLTPAADSPDGGEDRAGSDHVGHRTKAFAFYGQDESDSSGDEDTQHSDH